MPNLLELPERAGLLGVGKRLSVRKGDRQLEKDDWMKATARRGVEGATTTRKERRRGSPQPDPGIVRS